MAMNGTTLGDTIAAHFSGGLTPAEFSAIQVQWRLIATDIVSHIQANAVVNTTISVATANGVLPGGATAPVTGSTLGTVS